MRFQIGKENDSLIRRIEESIRNGRISHAYLAEGPAHLDKSAFARSFAKGILCPVDLGENCGRCAICDKIDHDNHEDLIYVRRLQSKQTVGIDLIRQMQSQIAIKPNGERYVVIIEESDLLTEEAQNCLLKTLEEPPGGTVLFLLTDNAEKLLPTIRSRCVRYRIEGSEETADQEMVKLAAELLDQLLQGRPFYQTRKLLGEKRRDKLQALELIDCMEERCRELILSRNDNGVLYSPEEISRCVDALESAREQLVRGLSAPYVLKRFLLTIGG